MRHIAPRASLLLLCTTFTAFTFLACSGNDGSVAVDADAAGADGSSGAGDGSSGGGGDSGGGGGDDSGAKKDSGGDAASGAFDWFPGNYLLIDATTASDITTQLSSPARDAFVGVQVRYLWHDCEVAQNDYSGCMAKMDADVAAADALGKKIILFLQYKTFDTSQPVPAYLLGAGPWCVSGGDAGQVCGSYPMGNGTTAMVWVPGVAARLHAWFDAIGQHFASSPHAGAIAGINLPETACSSNPALPLPSVGYTAPIYEAAIEENLRALVHAFPTKLAFQYTNFLPAFGSDTTAASLGKLADFALATPHVGLGCPDLAPMENAPFYAWLKDAKYQGRVPFQPAVESPDYKSARTPSLAATYDLGVKVAPAGMDAQMISWANVNASGDVFTTDEVNAYIKAHGPFPNVARPTW